MTVPTSSQRRVATLCVIATHRDSRRLVVAFITGTSVEPFFGWGTRSAETFSSFVQQGILFVFVNRVTGGCSSVVLGQYQQESMAGERNVAATTIRLDHDI